MSQTIPPHYAVITSYFRPSKFGGNGYDAGKDTEFMRKKKGPRHQPKRKK